MVKLVNLGLERADENHPPPPKSPSPRSCLNALIGILKTENRTGVDMHARATNRRECGRWAVMQVTTRCGKSSLTAQKLVAYRPEILSGRVPATSSTNLIRKPNESVPRQRHCYRSSTRKFGIFYRQLGEASELGLSPSGCSRNRLHHCTTTAHVTDSELQDVRSPLSKPVLNTRIEHRNLSNISPGRNTTTLLNTIPLGSLSHAPYLAKVAIDQLFWGRMQGNADPTRPVVGQITSFALLLPAAHLEDRNMPKDRPSDKA